MRLKKPLFGRFFIVALALRALGNLLMSGVHIRVGADFAFPDIGFLPDKLGERGLFLEKNPQYKNSQKGCHHVKKYGH